MLSIKSSLVSFIDVNGFDLFLKYLKNKFYSSLYKMLLNAVPAMLRVRSIRSVACFIMLLRILVNLGTLNFNEKKIIFKYSKRPIRGVHWISAAYVFSSRTSRANRAHNLVYTSRPSIDASLTLKIRNNSNDINSQDILTQLISFTWIPNRLWHHLYNHEVHWKSNRICVAEYTC